MGYTLKIGEACVEYDLKERWAHITVAAAEDSSAPLGSTPAMHHCNECWPSYTAWANFLRAVGLSEVFFAESRQGLNYTPAWVGPSGTSYTGLLSEHPGLAELTQDHLDAFQAAAARYKPDPEGIDKNGIDWNHRRLEWLVWWTEWALRNCANPSFGNG